MTVPFCRHKRKAVNLLAFQIPLNLLEGYLTPKKFSGALFTKIFVNSVAGA